MGQQQQQKPLATLPPFPAGITAVALCPQHVSAAAAAAVASAQQHIHLLAVGLEDGRVQVWQLQMQDCWPVGPGAESAQRGQVVCRQLWCSEVWQQHAAAVKRLRWAPAAVSWLCDDDSQGTGLKLASCAEDNSVRVFSVAL